MAMPTTRPDRSTQRSGDEAREPQAAAGKALFVFCSVAQHYCSGLTCASVAGHSALAGWLVGKL
jgi:hypothetical protein